MSQDICGNCKSYERGNAWSGTCIVDRHATSPGVSCTIGRFDAHASIRQEPARGAFRQANYSNGSGTLDMASGKITEFVTRVEVLAVVGAWAMVRRAEPMEPNGFMFDENLASRANKPFVAETMHLDFGDGVQ